MQEDRSIISREKVVSVLNGWLAFIRLLAIAAADFTYLVLWKPEGAALLPDMFVLAICVFMFRGFFSLQPNEARVLVLFGSQGDGAEKRVPLGQPLL